MGPLLLSLYMPPIGNVISGFGISLSQYTADTHLYISLKDERALSLLHARLLQVVVHWWFTLNGVLSLNADKSEAIINDWHGRSTAK